MARSLPAAADRFAQQADLFDQRAGLPDDAARAVALAVARIAGLGQGDLVVEIGAGTGSIGWHLAQTCARYLGLDVSWPMLDRFRRRLGASGQLRLLLLADAEQPWPVRAQAATLVFASRVAHLLDPAHLASELGRVCRPGGWFLIGRTARDPTSLKSRLRDQRLQVLSPEGGRRRGGEAGRRRLLEVLAAHGYQPVPATTVATWSGATTAERIIGDWEAMEPAQPGYDGLRAWARHELGDLDQVQPFTEHYLLEGVRLPLPQEACTTTS